MASAAWSGPAGGAENFGYRGLQPPPPRSAWTGSKRWLLFLARLSRGGVSVGAAADAADAAAAAAAKRERDVAALGRSDPNDPSRTGASGRRPGSGGTVDRVTSGPGRNVDDTGQAYDSGGREGFGFGLADGGRVPYMMGGLTDLVDIYD